MLAWGIASALVGISLGLYFGKLMAAIILNWESSGAAIKAWMALVAFVFGGGALGSTALFAVVSSSDNAAFYLGGWGLGAIFAYFRPRLPARHTLQNTTEVVLMSDELQPRVPDPNQRALLITAVYASPKSIEREAKISEDQLAKALEEAADALVIEEQGE